MQLRPHAHVFMRNLVAAATVRPMLNLLLEMKQARVVTTRTAAPAPETAVAPCQQPRAA